MRGLQTGRFRNGPPTYCERNDAREQDVDANQPKNFLRVIVPGDLRLSAARGFLRFRAAVAGCCRFHPVQVLFDPTIS